MSALDRQLDAARVSAFECRLNTHFAALHECYSQLYGSDADSQRHFQSLLQAVAESYSQRSDDLFSVDEARVVSPQWHMSPNWVGTMLYVDRYSHDLASFDAKLSYLEELGVNYVHLMPLLKMPVSDNDGGYAVSDYREVDPRLGSMADLRRLACHMRGRGMLLELDLVLNHTADEHEWAVRAKAGEAEYQAMYHVFDDRETPDQYEQTMNEVFPETAPGNFVWCGAMQKWVMTRFHDYQWDLNFANPRVLCEMFKVLMFLANQGVDILRLDAVAFTWKALGTSCQNLPQAHLILQILKACTRIAAPGVLFKAEAIVQPAEIVKYLGDSGADECEIAYNASLMVYLWDTVATGNAVILNNGLRHLPRLPDGTLWINYIRCHDDIGLGYDDADISSSGLDPFAHRQFIIQWFTGEFSGSDALGQRFMFNPKNLDARISGATAALIGLEAARARDDLIAVDTAVAKLLLLHSVTLSIGGIPVIYYGDELALGNDYSFLNDPAKSEDNRWLNRPIMNWEIAARRQQPDTVEARVFSGLQHRIALRKGLPEFHNANDFDMLAVDNAAILAFRRQLGDKATVVVANFSNGWQRFEAGWLGLNRSVDVLTGRALQLEDNQLVVPPLTCHWARYR